MSRSRIIPSPSGRILTLPDGRRLPVVAWTGGEWPGAMSPDLRRARSAFFREQLQDWRTAWGDWPDRYTLKIMWTRALGDAWRTLNP